MKQETNKNLEESLDNFCNNYGRKIIFDSQDKVFYELSGNKKSKVSFPSYASKNWEIEQNNFYNHSVEEQLSLDNRSLRQIILEKVDELVHEELVSKGLMARVNGNFEPTAMGVCHEFWKRKKEILNQYNILWASPCDENPGVLYD
jgi:hypothetical protein